MEPTRIYIQRAPEGSEGKYVTLTGSGQYLAAWLKLSDISEYYRFLYGNTGKVQLIRQLDKTYTPKAGRTKGPETI